MTLQELFKKLSYGPFSNIALGNEGNGTILDAKQPAVIEHLNDALMRIHARFILKESELILKLQADTTLYTISSKNAVSYLDTDPANPAYIQDSESNPYPDDLLRILSVWDSDGIELPLNQEGNTNSLFTPQLNVLQVPAPVENKLVHVLYQARQMALSSNLPIDLNTVFEIPAVLEQPLIEYIAYKVYSGMNSQEHKAIAANHLTMYDNLCMEAIERDLVGSSQSVSNQKLDERGFV